jgi:hypothetical protein
MATAKKIKPPAVCRLALTIAGVDYRVRFISAPAFGATDRAVRLRKVGADAAYNVAPTLNGPTCDCGDQVWRHEGRDDLGCKHIRACRVAGLIR